MRCRCSCCRFDGSQWLERGVVVQGDGFGWGDRPTALRPPIDGPFGAGTVTEIHPQAEAFIATLAERLTRGAAFFIDYGFPRPSTTTRSATAAR